MTNKYNNIFSTIINSILAGIMIVVGCIIYVQCKSQYIGAALFAVALLTICCKKYFLFTGKCGDIVRNDIGYLKILFIGLTVNLVTVILVGNIIGELFPEIRSQISGMVNVKLSVDNVQLFTKAIFCGILMEVAVSIYKTNHSILGIIFCIPVFILSGYEHSIADACFLALTGKWSHIFMLIVISGNLVGSLFVSGLEALREVIL